MSESIEQVMQRLRQEFIESCQDKLDEIDVLLLRLESGKTVDSAKIFDFQRNVHSIKGQGGTFGFPLISQIAHLLEDYLACVGDIRASNPNDIRAFLEQIGKIIGAGHSPSQEESERILRALPVHRAAGFSNQPTRDVRIHSVMPRGIQQEIVRHELISCGFHVTQSKTAMEALASILAAPPDIVIATQVLEGFSGVELARVLQAIEATRRIRFLLLTSYEEADEHLSGLPKEAAVIVKDSNFAARFAERLLGWGVFGKVGHTDLHPDVLEKERRQQANQTSDRSARDKATLTAV